MDQAMHTAHVPPLSPAAGPHPMVRLPAIVRATAAEMLCATDTRIVKIAAEHDAGWKVEVEVFAPNPELTISMRGGTKAILERSRHCLHYDSALQLVALEPAEE